MRQSAPRAASSIRNRKEPGDARRYHWAPARHLMGGVSRSINGSAYFVNQRPPALRSAVHADIPDQDVHLLDETSQSLHRMKPRVSAIASAASQRGRQRDLQCDRRARARLSDHTGQADRQDARFESSRTFPGWLLPSSRRRASAAYAQRSALLTGPEALIAHPAPCRPTSPGRGGRFTHHQHCKLRLTGGSCLCYPRYPDAQRGRIFAG